MIDSLLKDIVKMNEYASILEVDTISNIKDYISTGSLILNTIISGDFNKGVPAGRITTFSGLSGTGKSLLAVTTLANAQAKGYDVVYFDSEFATDKDTMIRLGANPKKCIKIPIASLEEFKTQAFKILSVFEETAFKKGQKLMIVLDSLGNLASQKELDDTIEGKNAADMGLKAKMIRSIFRLLADKLGKLAVPMIVINHTYANPGNPYAGETMSGGGGIQYISHVVVNLKRTVVKDADKQVTGTILKPTVTKNRLIPPFMSGEILIDFKTGIDKYYGLLELGESSGLIIKDGKRFKTIKSDKLEWEKNIYCDEFFAPILDDLNIYLQNNNKYSSEESEYTSKDLQENE